MKILWEKTPVWFDNRRPVINAVEYGYKTGQLAINQECGKSSGFDFEAQFLAWFNDLAPGSHFSFGDWLEYVMPLAGGSGVDKILATKAYCKLSKKCKKRFVGRIRDGQGKQKIWEKV